MVQHHRLCFNPSVLCTGTPNDAHSTQWTKVHWSEGFRFLGGKVCSPRKKPPGPEKWRFRSLSQRNILTLCACVFVRSNMVLQSVAPSCRMSQGRNFGAHPDCIQEAIKKIDLSGEARGIFTGCSAHQLRLKCMGCIPAVAIHAFVQQPTQDQPCISLVAMAYGRTASIYTSIYSRLLHN